MSSRASRTAAMVDAHIATVLAYRALCVLPSRLPLHIVHSSSVGEWKAKVIHGAALALRASGLHYSG